LMDPISSAFNAVVFLDLSFFSPNYFTYRAIK
jgi:hypothetical protein